VKAEEEALWPYHGFTVRARERKLGEGKLTLTEQSLLFESSEGTTIYNPEVRRDSLNFLSKSCRARLIFLTQGFDGFA
jgi:hypothetical protein